MMKVKLKTKFFDKLKRSIGEMCDSDKPVGIGEPVIFCKGKLRLDDWDNNVSARIHTTLYDEDPRIPFWKLKEGKKGTSLH